MEELKKQLKQIIKQTFKVKIEPEVTLPPEGEGADYATNVAMKLAGQVRLAPLKIAEQIAEKVKGYEVSVAKPGFLNFKLPDEYYIQKMGDFAGDLEKNISQGEYSGKTVICEFSDPNPFKVLHVGHLYTSVVGDAIAGMIEFAGARVIRANFGGDVGLHVAKTVYIMEKRQAEMKKLAPEERADFMADCYVEGTKLYEKSEVAKGDITLLNWKIYKLVEADDHDSELAKVYWQGREWSYEYFEDFYAQIGVKFDKYYPESAVVGKGLEIVKKQLDKGVYEKSEGAIVYKGEKKGLHTRVFINNEGLPTYETKDVGLLFSKWQDYRFDESIVITGNDIVDYMKVVLASVSEYEPELVKRTIHLTHGNVKLPGNKKMSSREGNFLSAVEVLGITRKALGKEYKTKVVDEKVVMGAVKYAFLKYRMGGDIIFDIKESVSMNGNSGPYLQYAGVRAKRILDKVGKKSGEWVPNEFERELMKKIVHYTETLSLAIREKAPHRLCNYLYELAQEFSRFYEQVQVAGSECESERGKLVAAYLKVLTHGLDLLGIEIPEEM